MYTECSTQAHNGTFAKLVCLLPADIATILPWSESPDKPLALSCPCRWCELPISRHFFLQATQ